VRDCFTLTVRAFNLAETFRCPVFIASNKEIGMTRESVDLEALEKPALVDRTAPPDRAHFQPFQISNGQTVPYFLPIGDSIPVRQTSSTHGADGYITTDAGEIRSFQRRLQDKLQISIEHYSYHEFIAENTRTLLITYGVTARAAKAACRLLRQQGRPVSLLVLKTLWPLPEALIRRSARQAERVVVIEMNLGQYVDEIRRILPDKPIDFFGQMDGHLITPRQIEEVIDRG
jgi:2-oxoglutarate ferredoxin oxidoreductase subunit alpha